MIFSSAPFERNEQGSLIMFLFSLRLQYRKAKGPAQLITGQFENENTLSLLLSETTLFKIKKNLAKVALKYNHSSWTVSDTHLDKVKVNEEKQSEKPYLHITVNYSTIQQPQFFISFYSNWKKITKGFLVSF